MGGSGSLSVTESSPSPLPVSCPRDPTVSSKHRDNSSVRRSETTRYPHSQIKTCSPLPPPVTWEDRGSPRDICSDKNHAKDSRDNVSAQGLFVHRTPCPGTQTDGWIQDEGRNPGRQSFISGEVCESIVGFSNYSLRLITQNGGPKLRHRDYPGFLIVNCLSVRSRVRDTGLLE